MKNRVVILLALITVVSANYNLYAQQDPQSSLYMFNPLQFNPAYAGSRGSINALGAFRYQWVGWEGAPKTGYFTAHMPFARQNIGVGLNFVNDNIGSWNNISAFASFAYSIRLNRKNDRLAFGINGGVDYYQAYYADLRVIDGTDASYLDNINKITPNFGLGIYYHGKRHFIGVSTPRLLEHTLNSAIVGDLSKTKRHYYFTAGYVFKFNSAIDFKPSLLMKLTENAPITFDINASFLFYKKFWIGMNYRYHESVGINTAFTIKNSLYIGYAYDFPINEMMLNQYGTHEFLLGFDIKPSKKAVMSPRYF